MKIALLSWESVHSIYVGGIAAHVTELGVALARKGHEVHVFTRVGHGQDTYSLIDGVHYHRCPYDGRPHFLEDVDSMCHAFVHSVIDAEDHGGPFDIIHGHDWLTANALVWLKQARRRTIMFTIHSTEFGRCGNNFSHGDSQAISHREWEALYVSDRAIAVSKTLKNEVIWLYNTPSDKVEAIYNGVNCQKYDGWIDAPAVRRMHDIGPDDPIVLFAGRMVYQKGPDLLMEAIPHLLFHRPEMKFVFGGDGGMRWQVEDNARHLGVHHACRFLGHLGGWQLDDLFKTADCVCVPSRNEPFGIVILEAWSAGKPVVVTKNGGPNEFVWHDVNGYKVDANPDAIGWGIGTLLNNKGHAEWMGRNGRLAVEKAFSWDHIADQTAGVYESALAAAL